MHAAIVILIVSIAIASASSSPLSPFYDNYVSTSASLFRGDSFGRACARGGAVPIGFIPVAMNGRSMGLPEAVGACGLCLHIKGPAPPAGTNPTDTRGAITGEYFAFVYDVCASCSEARALQLGVPGDVSTQPTDVVWRAIPCPTSIAGDAAAVVPALSLFFEGASAARARFQVRGLASPIVTAMVDGQALAMDGAFFVYAGAYPFVVEVESGLGEVVSIEVPAYRAHGILSDLIKVEVKRAARTTGGPVPIANRSDALAGAFGTGHITTVSGAQTRTVITTNQDNRQIISILTSPNDQAAQAQQVLSSQRGFGNQNAIVIDQSSPVRTSTFDATIAPRRDGTVADMADKPYERSLLESYLTSKAAVPSAINGLYSPLTNPMMPSLINAITPEPISTTTPAPTNATTPAPTNATTPAPTNATTPAPTNATTPAPTNATTSAPINATTSAPSVLLSGKDRDDSTAE